MDYYEYYCESVNFGGQLYLFQLQYTARNQIKWKKPEAERQCIVPQSNWWCSCSPDEWIGKLLLQWDVAVRQEKCTSIDENDTCCVTTTNSFAALINIVVLETVCTSTKSTGSDGSCTILSAFNVVRTQLHIQHVKCNVTICTINILSCGSPCKLHSVYLVILFFHFGNLQAQTLYLVYFSSMNSC